MEYEEGVLLHTINQKLDFLIDELNKTKERGNKNDKEKEKQ